MAPSIASIELGIDRQKNLRPLTEEEIAGNIMLQRQGGRGMIMKYLEAASRARDIDELIALKDRIKGEGTSENRVLLEINKYIAPDGMAYLWGITFEPDSLVKRYPEERLEVYGSPKDLFFAELDIQKKGLNTIATQLAMGIPGVEDGSLIKVGIYELGSSVMENEIMNGFERVEALANLERVEFEG